MVRVLQRVLVEFARVAAELATADRGVKVKPVAYCMDRSMWHGHHGQCTSCVPKMHRKEQRCRIRPMAVAFCTAPEKKRVTFRARRGITTSYITTCDRLAQHEKKPTSLQSFSKPIQSLANAVQTPTHRPSCGAFAGKGMRHVVRGTAAAALNGWTSEQSKQSIVWFIAGYHGREKPTFIKFQDVSTITLLKSSEVWTSRRLASS